MSQLLEVVSIICLIVAVTIAVKGRVWKSGDKHEGATLWMIFWAVMAILAHRLQ